MRDLATPSLSISRASGNPDGIPPGVGGPQRLARLIGWYRARIFAMKGTIIGASEALATGIVDEVADDAVEAAIRETDRFAHRPSSAVSEIMRQMRPSDDEHVGESILGFARCLTGEGTADAFAELASANIAIERLD